MATSDMEDATVAQSQLADDLYGDLGDALLQAEVEQLRTETATQSQELQQMSGRLETLTNEASRRRSFVSTCYVPSIGASCSNRQMPICI